MRDAAERVLRDAGGPLHTDEITRRALEQKLIQTKGKTPAATLAARLGVDVKRKDSRFVRTAPAIYGLRGRDRKGQRGTAAPSGNSS